MGTACHSYHHNTVPTAFRTKSITYAKQQPKTLQASRIHCNRRFSLEVKYCQKLIQVQTLMKIMMSEPLVKAACKILIS